MLSSVQAPLPECQRRRSCQLLQHGSPKTACPRCWLNLILSWKVTVVSPIPCAMTGRASRSSPATARRGPSSPSLATIRPRRPHPATTASGYASSGEPGGGKCRPKRLAPAAPIAGTPGIDVPATGTAAPKTRPSRAARPPAGPTPPSRLPRICPRGCRSSAHPRPFPFRAGVVAALHPGRRSPSRSA